MRSCLVYGSVRKEKRATFEYKRENVFYESFANKRKVLKD